MITSTGWSCGASLAAAFGFGDGFVLLALKLMRSFDCGVLIWVWFDLEDGVGAIGGKRTQKVQDSVSESEERERPRKVYGDERLAEKEREERRER